MFASNNCSEPKLPHERLTNISEHLGKSKKVRVKDEFSQKMVNGEHNLEVVRKTLVSGIKGHIRKVKRCEEEGIHFTGVRLIVQSLGNRRSSHKSRTGSDRSLMMMMLMARETLQTGWKGR